MTSHRPAPARHSAPSTTSNMLPAVLRPCCKGRLLSKIGGALSVAAFLYVCLAFQQASHTGSRSRQPREAEGSKISSGNRGLLRRNENKDNQEENIVFEDFEKLSQNFTVKPGAMQGKENLTDSFNSRLQREVSAMKDGLALHRQEISRFPCRRFEASDRKTSSSGLKVTLVYSLVGLDSIVDAVLLLRNHFEKLPTNLVDDVIVTVEEEAEDAFKAEVEELMDLCGVCRLFFFPGTIWEHRSLAVKFVRGEVLVFVDARVQPLSKDWAWPLVHAVTSSSHLVVSPNLRLRGGYQGRDFSVGVARHELTWSLAVARGPISDSEISEVMKLSAKENINGTKQKALLIDQSAVAKEVFAIRKSFFNHLGGFEIEKTFTGGEHVLFSLKILTCGGNIAVSLCSDVSLELASAVPSQPTYVRALTEMEKSLPPAQQRRVLDRLRFVSDAEFLARQSVYTVDFQNPSFLGSVYSTVMYFAAGQDIWMDSYSRKYSGCTIQPRLFSRRQVPRKKVVVDNSRRAAFGNYQRAPRRQEPTLGVRLKQEVSRRKCNTRNFRAIISKRQVRMLSPTKRATYYGYIRSADGLYAFGVSPAMTEDAIVALASSKPVVPAVGPGGVPFNTSVSNRDLDTRLNIVLTRNSSEWIGPFSHTNGAFVYQHSLCITRLPSNNLSLRKCLKGTREQLFVFASHMIKPAGSIDEWACAKLHRLHEGTSSPSPSLMTSGPVFLARCMGEGQGSTFTQFKMDDHFKENCVA